MGVNTERVWQLEVGDSLLTLGRKQRDAIESLAWGMEHFGSLHTNGVVTRRTVLSLVKKGIAESVGLTEQCDADGFTIEGRVRKEGFRLTAFGKCVHTTVLNMYAKMRERVLD